MTLSYLCTAHHVDLPRRLLRAKVGKSVKPNFNTYIYRVLKEVRVPRAAAAYDPPVWYTIIAWRLPHARGLTIGHWLWQ